MKRHFEVKAHMRLWFSINHSRKTSLERKMTVFVMRR